MKSAIKFTETSKELNSNLFNKSQKKGESYSLFVKMVGSRAQSVVVLHNASKSITENHTQIHAECRDENDVVVIASAKNGYDTVRLFTKEDLEIIAITFNGLISNCQCLNCPIIDSDENMRIFYEETEERKTIFVEKTKSSEPKNEKVVEEKKPKSPNKKYSIICGIALTKSEIEVLRNIIQEFNGDFTGAIFSHLVTKGSFSISGVISMLNRKGIVECQKVKLNENQKSVRSINLTKLGVEIAKSNYYEPLGSTFVTSSKIDSSIK